MGEQANIELVKKAYDAFQKGDINGVLALADPDVDWKLPDMEGIPFSGSRRGLGEVAEFFRQVDELMQLRSFTPREFIAQGDRVIVLGYYDWVIRKTGATLGAEWVHSFTIRNGKLIALEEFTDTAKVLEAFGLAGAGAALAGRPGVGPAPSVH